MVVVIKKDTKEEIDAAPERIKELDTASRKSFPAEEFAGKLKMDMDGVTYQRKIPDEWE